MSFQYALECVGLKVKNSIIENAISIAPTSLIPPFVCQKHSSNAGIYSSSPQAMGSFTLEFIVLDPGYYSVAADFTKLACSHYREPKKFKLTRYTVQKGEQEGEIIRDLEVNFNCHIICIALMDCDSEYKRHLFELVAYKNSAEVEHSTFSPSNGATKFRVCRDSVKKLLVDSHGNGFIQRG